MKRRMGLISPAAILLLATTIQCSSEYSPRDCPGPALPPGNEDKVTITQGIWGDVWFYEGNFMPGSCPSWGTIRAVRREVRLYEQTFPEMAEQACYFWKNPTTRLVARTWSDSTGFYQMAVPPGAYSLFVVEPYACNGTEVDSLLWPSGDLIDGAYPPLGGVGVGREVVTRHLIGITYKSYW